MGRVAAACLALGLGLIGFPSQADAAAPPAWTLELPALAGETLAPPRVRPRDTSYGTWLATQLATSHSTGLELPLPLAARLRPIGDYSAFVATLANNPKHWTLVQRGPLGASASLGTCLRLNIDDTAHSLHFGLRVMSRGAIAELRF